MATDLLVRIKQFKFAIACLALNKCFSLSRHAAEYLQREEMGITTAVAAGESLRATFDSAALGG